ncbi:hypothetical protein N7478_013278 [Penicillium angulare]|uniref:uncharacterized protein n=1 Tax=Penicillium angulare TaxID=116970 RepID=UPI00254232A1|nr:uncharacterized protein N7478_013278 [Penicillium angulare]KAJ5257174.1 hypothetical protein N7478_013278 [Penicillium angulare]
MDTSERVTYGNEVSLAKRTSKRELSSPEMPMSASESRTSRAGRIIKAPTAYAPVPSGTITGKRSSRKKDAIVCVHCHRGHSPSTNMIVFCDGCNATWHQNCHDPVIEDQVVLEQDAEWHCRSCKPVRRSTPVPSTKVKKPKRAIHPRLKTNSQLEAPGKRFTEAKRRAYLSQLSHAELVELAMKVTTKYPEVAMFPAKMTRLPASAFFSTQPNQSAPNYISNEITRSTSAAEEHIEPMDPPKRARTTSAPVKPVNFKNLTSKTKRKSESLAVNGEPLKMSTPHKRSRLNSAPACSILSTFEPPASEPLDGPQSLEMQARRASLRTKVDYARQFDVPFERSSKTLPVDPEIETPSVTDRESSPETSEPRDISQSPETETDSSSDAFESAGEHRLYPRPGNGFNTSTHPADLDILQEQVDYPTFSHSVHGLVRKPIPTKTSPPPRRTWSLRR